MNFRQQFPFFAYNPKLIYADSAATSQKPRCVINAMTDFLSREYATVHRSGYQLATESTAQFEQARRDICKLINAKDENSIVFTKGATEALNILATGLAECDWLDGSEILVCGSEHHANLLPWQRLAKLRNLKLRIMPINQNGCLQVEPALEMITRDTAIVAIAHVSNALGNQYPVEFFAQRAKQHNAISIIDGTQAIPHLHVDIAGLGCDFYAFSGHKMFASTGTGVLYGRYELLDKLPAYQLGGEMVLRADYQDAVYQKPPLKFEAGTPNIVGVIGLGHAAKFIADNFEQSLQHEKHLAHALFRELSTIEDINLLGDFSKGNSNIPIASFTLKDFHLNDLAVLLNYHNVAIRHGHHCAMPLMKDLGIEGTLRISLAAYNTEAEVSQLCVLLRQCIDQLKQSEASDPKVLDYASDEKSSLPLGDKISSCHSWDTVFREIMLAGKGLNTLPLSKRDTEYYVGGCEADVWLSSEPNLKGNGVVFSAYSPSKVVRGLLAIILEQANALTSPLQQDFDYKGYLAEIGLSRFLSESRQQGIEAVIDKIAKG